MTTKGKGRVIPHKRGGVYIYIPAEVAGDTLFPFKERCDVSVYLQGGRLIVEARREAGYTDEAELNFNEYLRVKDDYVRRYAGKIAVIVKGKVVCVTDSMEEAVRIADEKGSSATHRILWRIGRDEGAKIRKIRGSWLRRLR